MAVQAETSDLNVYILDIGEHVVNYTVPSFPVFSAQLRSIKFQLGATPNYSKPSLKNKRVDVVYDGFVWDCPSLQWNYPAWIVVDSNSDLFSICVEEFSQAINITNFVLYDGGVFVIWKWKWGENVYEAPDSPFSLQQVSDQTQYYKESLVTSSASEDEPETHEGITHAVVFKCIGSN